MQIVHCSKFRDREGNLLPEARKEAPMALGPGWKAMMEAEDFVAQGLAQYLDDAYVLLRNVTPPGLTHDADLIIVGPTGLWAVEVAYLKGLFKVDGVNWMSYTSKLEFEKVEPNLASQVRENAQAIFDFLREKKFSVPWVNPVIMLANSQIDVRTEEAAVAIIRPDGIEQYIAENILPAEPVFNPDEAINVAEAIIALGEPDEESQADAKKPSRFLGMTRSQLVVIVILALIDICVLGGFAFLVARDTLLGP